MTVPNADHEQLRQNLREVLELVNYVRQDVTEVVEQNRQFREFLTDLLDPSRGVDLPNALRNRAERLLG
jgi:arginine deiminase